MENSLKRAMIDMFTRVIDSIGQHDATRSVSEQENTSPSYTTSWDGHEDAHYRSGHPYQFSQNGYNSLPDMTRRSIQGTGRGFANPRGGRIFSRAQFSSPRFETPYGTNRPPIAGDTNRNYVTSRGGRGHVPYRRDHPYINSFTQSGRNSSPSINCPSIQGDTNRNYVTSRGGRGHAPYRSDHPYVNSFTQSGRNSSPSINCPSIQASPTFAGHHSVAGNYTHGNTHIETRLRPCIGEYQLLGASQLMRLASTILKESPDRVGNIRHIGLCVSGQKIYDLHRKIQNNFYPVGKKVIILIGTNDFIQRVPILTMVTNYSNMVSHLLKMGLEKIILLTLPPIPKLMVRDVDFWPKLYEFNKFLHNFAAQNDRVMTIDAAWQFMTRENNIVYCSCKYYETEYHTGLPDNVHLNTKGLELLHQAIISQL